MPPAAAAPSAPWAEPFFREQLADLLDDADGGALLAAVLCAHDLLADAFARGRKLLVAGNGGSFADAQHIVGELAKAFERPRPPAPAEAERLRAEPHGALLARELEGGLPAVAVGNNGALLSAVMNDKPDARLGFAQEVWALGRPGDVFWGISTSGDSVSVGMALSAARARGMATVGLTGRPGGALARRVDAAITAPGQGTAAVQEAHVRLYHALCRALERRLFA